MDYNQQVKDLLGSQVPENNELALELIQRVWDYSKKAALLYIYQFHTASFWKETSPRAVSIQTEAKAVNSIIEFVNYSIVTQFRYGQRDLDLRGISALDCMIALKARDGREVLLEATKALPKITAKDLPLSLANLKEAADEHFNTIAPKMAALIL